MIRPGSSTVRLTWLALCICSSAYYSFGLEIQDYSASRHNRFASGYPSDPVPNPDWFVGEYDWSGVGWDSSNSNRSVALISPQHFVCANHYKPSGNIIFRNRQGELESYSIAKYVTTKSYYGTSTYTSDLCLGELSRPVSPDIAYYPLLNPSSSTWQTGKGLVVYGFTARVGTNTVSGTYFTNGTHCYYFRVDSLPDEAGCQSGDSGSPSFFTEGNILSVAGTHSAIGGGACLDAFAQRYLDQLNAHMAPDYAVATLDPEVDNPTVSFTASSQAASEGDGTILVTAQLSAPSVYDVIIPFALTGTATAGTDFSATASPLTIPAGESSGSISVTLTDDTETETDETIKVTMWTPTNAIRGTLFEHTITIQDNEGAGSTPTVNFATASQSAAENAGQLTVTAQLSETTDTSVSVPFTVSGTAAPGTDYSITTSPLTIAAGQTSANITITVSDDAVDEFTETVVITMGTPTGADPGSVTTHTASIEDNDPTPAGDFDVDNDTGKNFRDLVFCTRSWDVAIGETVPSGAWLPDGESSSSVDTRVDELLVVKPDGFRSLDVDMDGVVDMRDFTFIERRLAMHLKTVPDGTTLPDGVTEADLNARIDRLLTP